MKIVIFGLTISSSWGNGHATLWRGLCRALIARGHRVIFFERDVPYYATHRDLMELPGGRLVLYGEWTEVRSSAARELGDTDVAITTSYCVDALVASELLLESPALRVFYDLDTPVTLCALRAGETVPYLNESGLTDYDLVLSYTGGGALEELQSSLGARRVAPLYGSVDPVKHCPAQPMEAYRADLSYLGTYAQDRQAVLETLLLEPARQRPEQRFIIGGAKYPNCFPWSANIYFVQHLPPSEHGAFFSSSRITLNVTRAAMAKMGYCPSGRLFEAAACGVPILSDRWEGLGEFFEPGSEILLASETDHSLQALDLSDAELARIARAARERVLDQHTAMHRTSELEGILQNALSASVNV